MIDIEGTWYGNYSFAKGYDDLLRDLVLFELKIMKGFQSFIGSMTEDVESGGIDDEILIEGVSNGQRIYISYNSALITLLRYGQTIL